MSTVKTVSSYIISAWWFAVVAIASSPRHAELSWVKSGDMATPDRLNERPIYLTGVFVVLGISQSIVHLSNDLSSLRIEVSPLPPPADSDQRTHRIAPISYQLQVAIIPILRRSLATSFISVVAGPFVYTLCFRKFLWRWHLIFAKLWFNIPRSDALPSGYPPANPFMILRSFSLAFLLVLTWEISTFLFAALMIQQPLKEGQPLSAASKDPNGTLLNGIKAKNDIVKTFAFWELALIARSFPERRKAIFADIERNNGTCWDQMQGAALDVIRAITLRINPPDPAKETEPASRKAAANGSPMPVNSLPQIASPLSKKNILSTVTAPQTQKEKLQSLSGSIVKSLGQSPRPWSPSISKIKGVLEHAKPAGLSNDFPATFWGEKWSALQASPIGRALSWLGAFLQIPTQQKIIAERCPKAVLGG